MPAGLGDSGQDKDRDNSRETLATLAGPWVPSSLGHLPSATARPSSRDRSGSAWIAPGKCSRTHVSNQSLELTESHRHSPERHNRSVRAPGGPASRFHPSPTPHGLCSAQAEGISEEARHSTTWQPNRSPCPLPRCPVHDARVTSRADIVPRCRWSISGRTT